MAKKSGKKREAVSEQPIEERTAQWSIGDPAFASWLYGPQVAGVTVTSDTALGVPAFWRAVNLISTTVASLPLKVYRGGENERLEVSGTWIENPCPWMTPFAFKQTVVTHLALDGNAFLLHIYGGAGQILGVQPVHPQCVAVEWDPSINGKLFKVTVNGEQRTYTSLDMTHVHCMSTDGLRGLSPIWTARAAIGTAVAGNEAAARTFANGGMIAGIVTSPNEDLPEEEARQIKQDLDTRMTGVSNAGSIAFVNRNLEFSKWMMTADEAQFVEQRSFSVEEIARITGVPKVLLASDGASTWGSGIQELNRGLARFTLPAYIQPIEEALSSLLPSPRWVEFEMKQLLQATPEEEIRLLIEQVAAGLLTVDEARAILNKPPLPEAPAQKEEVIDVAS